VTCKKAKCKIETLAICGPFLLFHRVPSVKKSMKAIAYRLSQPFDDRTASLVMSSFFPSASSLHAPIGRHSILPCHGKIKRAFIALPHLGNPLNGDRSSTIDPRPIAGPQ